MSLCKVLQSAAVVLVQSVKILSLDLLLVTLYLDPLLLVRYLHSTRTVHCAQVPAVSAHHTEGCPDDIRPRSRDTCYNFSRRLPSFLLFQLHMNRVSWL